jgi:uncharacterized protein (TIGR02266 family)
VSDPVSMARTARESLARGLNALQGDPSIPPQLVDLGQPIAQAMGALYKIEASRGAELQPHAQTALSNVQGALASLQAQPAQHPAVAAAMEAVAGALASVHALSRSAQAPAAAPAPQYAQPQYAQQAPAPQYQQPQAAPQAYAPQGQANPYASTAAPGYAPAAPAPAAPAYAPAPPAAAPGASSEAHAAELGAHSPSNFYKGLSGNDIVDHGGLFVSTYKLPKLGTRVRLKVSMPGGYEFEANAVVRWRREPTDASDGAPPGFGAQFTDITAEARQLVYRYVRNREPMFHDDL